MVIAGTPRPSIPFFRSKNHPKTHLLQAAALRYPGLVESSPPLYREQDLEVTPPLPPLALFSLFLMKHGGLSSFWRRLPFVSILALFLVSPETIS